MDRADFQQQQADEEERMTVTLSALGKVHEAGLWQEACFLSGELGLRKEFLQSFQPERKVA